MSSVQCGDLGDAKPLRRGDDRRVNCSEREVSVPPYQLGDARPVERQYRLDEVAAAGDVRQKSHLDRGSEPGPDEVSDVSDDELRDDERAGMPLD